MINEFAIWLDKQLAAREWSQRYFAEVSGVSHSTIARLIRGETLPRLDTLTAIARALELPLDEVWRQAGRPAAALDTEPVIWEIVQQLQQLSAEDLAYALRFLQEYIAEEYGDISHQHDE